MGQVMTCDCCGLPSSETTIGPAYLTKEGILAQYPDPYSRAMPPLRIDLCVSCGHHLRETWDKCRAREFTGGRK